MTSKDWLLLSIVTFLAVASWTIYDIYHAAVTSTITPVQQEMIRPLDPTFDLDTLRTLQSREE
jgi:hypothetical protein